MRALEFPFLNPGIAVRPQTPPPDSSSQKGKRDFIIYKKITLSALTLNFHWIDCTCVDGDLLQISGLSRLFHSLTLYSLHKNYWKQQTPRSLHLRCLDNSFPCAGTAATERWQTFLKIQKSRWLQMVMVTNPSYRLY